MTVSGTVGTSTPLTQPQGGELFRGFSALGNRVYIPYISIAMGPFSSAFPAH